MRLESLADPLVSTPEAAREFLEKNPRVWPYAMTALFGFVGLGSAAKAFGLDEVSFGRVVTAANEQLGAVKEEVGTGRKVAPRADLLLV